MTHTSLPSRQLGILRDAELVTADKRVCYVHCNERPLPMSLRGANGVLVLRSVRPSQPKLLRRSRRLRRVVSDAAVLIGGFGLRIADFLGCGDMTDLRSKADRVPTTLGRRDSQKDAAGW